MWWRVNRFEIIVNCRGKSFKYRLLHSRKYKPTNSEVQIRTSSDSKVGQDLLCRVHRVLESSLKVYLLSNLRVELRNKVTNSL